MPLGIVECAAQRFNDPRIGNAPQNIGDRPTQFWIAMLETLQQIRHTARPTLHECLARSLICVTVSKPPVWGGGIRDEHHDQSRKRRIADLAIPVVGQCFEPRRRGRIANQSERECRAATYLRIAARCRLQQRNDGRLADSYEFLKGSVPAVRTELIDKLPHAGFICRLGGPSPLLASLQRPKRHHRGARGTRTDHYENRKAQKTVDLTVYFPAVPDFPAFVGSVFCASWTAFA